MKYKLLIISIFTLIFFTNASTQNKGSYDLSKMDKYFKKSMKQWKIPGMAIAIVKNDSVIFSKGYGLRDINKRAKVDENTLFAIASNTKAFTATAIGILVDEGKLKLDDPVRKYMPNFKLYAPYVSENFTVRDLLCHRSGLATFSGDLLWYASNYSRKELIERAAYLKPKYGFRTSYGYSNIMYLVAGELVSIVSGESWDKFIENRFLKPLNMKNTNTSITKFKAKGNIAMPHNVFETKTVKIKYINWDNIAPAGSINSSVKDMSNWIKMQLNNGKFNNKQIVSLGSINKMRQSHTSKNVSRASTKIWQSKHFSSYGLGWNLFDYHARKIINHGGGADGMISRVVIVPEEDFGFVILTNSINYLPRALMYYILDEFISNNKKDWSNFYYGYYKQGIDNDKANEKKDEENRIKNTKPSLELSKYTGTYGGKLYGNAEVILKKNNLIVKFIPTPLFLSDLKHWHYDTFSIKIREIPSLKAGKLTFILNNKGQVDEMKIDIPNPDFDFTELKFKKLK